MGSDFDQHTADWCDNCNSKDDASWSCKIFQALHPVVLSSLSLSATTTIWHYLNGHLGDQLPGINHGMTYHGMTPRGWLKIVQHHWAKIKWNKSVPRKEHHILLGREMVNLGLTQKKSRSVKNNDWLRKWRHHWTHCCYQFFEPKMILFIILNKTLGFFAAPFACRVSSLPKRMALAVPCWSWRNS